MRPTNHLDHEAMAIASAILSKSRDPSEAIKIGAKALDVLVRGVIREVGEENAGQVILRFQDVLVRTLLALKDV